MTVHSAWLPDTGQSRQDTRLSPTGTFTPTSAVATRSGVVPGSPDGSLRISGFTVAGLTPMTAQVLPGRAVVQGLDAQGAYAVALSEPVTLTFADGNAQNPRIDLVVLRVYDDQFDGLKRAEATVEIVGGQAGPTPQPPQAPASSLPLYQVLVPAGASAAKGIDWLTGLVGVRNTTVAAGGILPVTTDTAPGAYPGQYRDVGDTASTGHMERWNGHGWVRYPVNPDPVWQSWTPVWTTESGAKTPSYGNATVNCRYVRFGPTVHLTVEIIFNSSTDFGGGGSADNWRFSLPVQAATAAQCIGFAELNSGVPTRAVARLRCTTTSVFELEICSTTPAVTDPPTGLVDAVSPWTWAAGHAIRATATYEAAA